MSRDITDLRPEMTGRVMELQQAMRDEGVPVLIYSTLRTMREQARLYRQGRSFSEIHHMAERLKDQYGRPDLAQILLSVGPQYGPVRTNAGPGQSDHNYGLAADGVPLRNGDPVWGDTAPEDAALWDTYGRVAKEVGLAWGGDWESFTDKPHVYWPGASWEELIKEG